VTGGTVATDIERCVTVVAGTTRLTGLHSFHPNLVAVRPGLEYPGVTLVTIKHFGMDLMTKKNGPGCIPNNDILFVCNAGRMADVAIFTDAERRITVVASTTGRPGRHLPHSHLVAVGLGIKYAGVTFAATKHLSMKCMTERDSINIIGFDAHINGSTVTSGTVFGNPKRRIAIVTGAAGFTCLHFLHPNLVAVDFGLEHLRMTFITAEHLGVNIVAERNCADVFSLNHQVNSPCVASYTVTTHAESRITIVTGTTGFTCLHFLHANLVAVGLGSEDIGMAFIATEHLGVNIVPKNNLSHGAVDKDVISEIKFPGMASAAIFADVERSLTVMAGTT
jgi:hypothetical protein